MLVLCRRTRLCSQRLAGPVQTHPRRDLGDAERGSGLGDRELVDCDEFEDDAFALGEPLEGGEARRPGLSASSFPRGGRRRRAPAAVAPRCAGRTGSHGLPGDARRRRHCGRRRTARPSRCPGPAGRCGRSPGPRGRSRRSGRRPRGGAPTRRATKDVTASTCRRQNSSNSCGSRAAAAGPPRIGSTRSMRAPLTQTALHLDLGGDVKGVTPAELRPAGVRGYG